MKSGEVWIINLDPTIGAEIKKSRPCVIVNNNIVGKMALKIIVPLTEWKEKYELADWHIPITNSTRNGLSKKSSADTFQVRSVSERRFVRRIGKLTITEIETIENGLKIVLNLG